MNEVNPLTEEIDPGPLVDNQMTVQTLQKAVLNAPRDLDILRGSLRRLLTRNAWRDRLDPHRLARFTYSAEEFVKFVSDPLPEGLDTSVEVLRKLIAEDVELLAMFEEAVTRGPGGNNNPEGNNQHGEREEVNHDNVMIDHPTPPQALQGNSLSYAARRLARDRPDLLVKVKSGELSCHAAMVAAGFRKVPTALDLLRRDWAKATDTERFQFLREITPSLQEAPGGAPSCPPAAFDDLEA